MYYYKQKRGVIASFYMILTGRAEHMLLELYEYIFRDLSKAQKNYDYMSSYTAQPNRPKLEVVF